MDAVEVAPGVADRPVPTLALASLQLLQRAMHPDEEHIMARKRVFRRASLTP